MAHLAIVATIKTAEGKRDEYLKFLAAHRKRCLETEPGTVSFEILVPQNEPDTIMLYELYDSPEGFDAHVKGTSMVQIRREAAGLQVSLTGVRCNVVV